MMVDMSGGQPSCGDRCQLDQLHGPIGAGSIATPRMVAEAIW